ncbi:MAG: hypothetical protein IID32_06550 [Planctomycetes bacterium]|nr:hypothetical protein [Planctomycetota bacterium]
MNGKVRSMFTMTIAALLSLLLAAGSCKKDTGDSTKPPSEESKSAVDNGKPEKDNNDDKSVAAAGLVPIELELPRPMFVGTPQNLNVEHLQKPLGKPRPPFFAPAETKNVAFEKPVTSTDNEPIIGEIEMITDGDKEAMDGSYVELGPLKQSVTVDLGDSFNVYAIVLWHYHKQARIYFDVVVQVSEDPDFINSKIVFNNDIDNSTGMGVGRDMHYVETSEGKLIDAKGVKARYVRFFSNGSNSNDLNHYIEVAVYGKPAT